MDLQLFSIERLPPALPIWDHILADLGHPPAARIARALGVGHSTVYRWTATGNAPRAAALALFWLTRWGRSAVHTQATNDAILAVQLARSLTEERLTLRAQVDDLERLSRQLQIELATRPGGRDSAATVHHSRNRTSPEDRPEEHDATRIAPLRWPQLSPQAPWPELPELRRRTASAAAPEPWPDERAGCPGSPAAPRQGGR